MMVTRSSRARFTDLPPEVISIIVAAAHPDEAAVSAVMSATCRSLRSIVLSTCTAIKLQRFGRGRQIAPLLQRFTGAVRPSYYIPAAAIKPAGCIYSTHCILYHTCASLRAGLQQVALASCVCDTVLWQELEQLQHLQHLTLP